VRLKKVFGELEIDEAIFGWQISHNFVVLSNVKE